MKEGEIVKACLDYLGKVGIFAWRQNTTGVFNPKSGGYFFHGKKGVSDILGILPQTCVIEGERVTFGNFLAVEVKTPVGKVSEAQRAFLDEIRQRGGLALVVRSVDDLHEGLAPYL